MGRRSIAAAAVGIAARSTVFAIVILGAFCRFAAAAELLPLVVYAEPGADADSLWMAEAKDVFKAEGLDVQIRLFPSGTTALQTFKTGAGDIIFSGTPAGVGNARTPKRFIGPSDDLLSEIEGIGHIHNTFRAR